ncbi:MAG: 3'-5' exonuclease [Elainella sp. Prado103]|nr:3'-5' exonuclease [Elainella sp. Prado103]
MPRLTSIMRSTELLNYYRNLSQGLLTVVDVETTGRYAWSDRITEISVLQATLADGIQQQRTDLVNPQTRIPLKIVQFTGITQAMVEAAPAGEEVFPNYLPLLNQGVLTAHNVAFDYPFLQTEYARLGIQFARSESEQLCTVQLARLMLPDLRSRSLPELVKYFQFPVGTSHRAEADTLACWLLAKTLLLELLETADPILLARFARQRIPLKLAAQLLNCSQVQARSRLEAAGVATKFVGQGRSGTWMYRRGDVEQLAEQAGSCEPANQSSNFSVK